jgi:hypothetical protein
MGNGGIVATLVSKKSFPYHEADAQCSGEGSAVNRQFLGLPSVLNV